jgi:hypothetical protein
MTYLPMRAGTVMLVEDDEIVWGGIIRLLVSARIESQDGCGRNGTPGNH